MLVQLDARGRIKLSQLLQAKLLNMEVATRLIAMLTSKDRYFNQPTPQALETESETLTKLMMTRLGYTKDGRVLKSSIQNYFPNGIVQLNPTIYETNPYFKTIRGKPIKKGPWTLSYQSYRPYQVFAYQDVYVDPKNNYQEVTPLGYFSKTLPYLAISENNITWMSVTPFEIETMQYPINQMRGQVIVFGLGLGYVAFMAARKKSVKHITIIEKDPQVIQLFKQHLLPQFPHQEKMTIIQQDAYHYLDHPASLQSFDSAFVDLYHDATDGLSIYINMKKIEALAPKITCYYWLEKSILALLRRYLLILIEEQQKGALEERYRFHSNLDDQVVNALYQVTKDITLRNEADLLAILSDKSLASLAKNMILKE